MLTAQGVLDFQKEGGREGLWGKQPAQNPLGDILGSTGFPRWLTSKESACQCPRCGFDSWEDPLEKEMATNSSILTGKIPQTEESSRLQSMGSTRVGRDLTTKQQLGSTLPAEKHRVSRKDNEGPWGGTSTQKIQAKIWMRLHSPSLPNLRAATAEVEELPGTKCRVLETRSPDT